MRTITFWYDPISPFAYLAFERLPQVLEECSYLVEYRPVVFGALLGHWGNKGPAEIEPKRQWTFRQVAWLAHQHGVPLQVPAQHPFNSLALQRLALACAAAGDGPNRRVVEAVLRHVWVGGADANDLVRLAALTEQLAPTRDAASADVKAELRANTDAAAAVGIFGVPTFELDGRHFWGLDALPMLRDALLGGEWFSGAGWDAATVAPPGLVRR